MSDDEKLSRALGDEPEYVGEVRDILRREVLRLRHQHEQDLVVMAHIERQRRDLAAELERMKRHYVEDTCELESQRDELANPTACRCRKCLAEHLIPVTWMVVCAICGNKRCPHATDHRNACTNSNAPGQVGATVASVHTETEPDHDRPPGSQRG